MSQSPYIYVTLDESIHLSEFCVLHPKMVIIKRTPETCFDI